MSEKEISYAIETINMAKKIQLKNNQSLSILDDITLQIPQGSSVAITGASGSGKTTLLGLLAGLDALFKLQEDNNSTLVLVTHDESLADQCQIHHRIVAGKLA